jgi:hypothetical protein
MQGLEVFLEEDLEIAIIKLLQAPFGPKNASKSSSAASGALTTKG